MESQFVAQENARRNQDHYPLAAETVLKSTYMDDSIDSVENDDEGVELSRQYKALWGDAASPVSPEFQTTKRSVLRKVATIFDPWGFVCPYILVAKILLQELWMRGYDWDNEVHDEIANKIGDWFEQLKILKEGDIC